jgi:hypothetical protein
MTDQVIRASQKEDLRKLKKTMKKNGAGSRPIPRSDDSEEDTWLEESDDSEQEREIRPACVVSVETAFDNKPDKYKTEEMTSHFVTVLDETELYSEKMDIS